MRRDLALLTFLSLLALVPACPLATSGLPGETTSTSSAITSTTSGGGAGGMLFTSSSSGMGGATTSATTSSTASTSTTSATTSSTTSTTSSTTSATTSSTTSTTSSTGSGTPTCSQTAADCNACISCAKDGSGPCAALDSMCQGTTATGSCKDARSCAQNCQDALCLSACSLKDTKDTIWLQYATCLCDQCKGDCDALSPPFCL